MSIVDASLRKTRHSPRAKKQVQNDFLDEVRLKGLRGTCNARVAFDYLVSVIAGPNGCGKSTVFACAAAYAPAGRSAAVEARGGPGRLETVAAHGDMAAFSVGLTEQIDGWRQAGAH